MATTTLMFEGKDVKELIELDPDYFLVQVTGADAKGEPAQATSEEVTIEAYKDGKKLLASKVGCPVPPCTPR